MKIEVHLLSHDDEPFLPWALRHYAQFATLVVVHDGGPKRLADEVIEAEIRSKSIEVTDCSFKTVPWDTAGEMNDELAMDLKNRCWRGTDADWVVVADADELLHFPSGSKHTLDAYERLGAAVVKPHGFEIFSEFWPEPDLHPGQQITTLIQDGAPDDKWYAKPILFSPRRVVDSGFGVGAHHSRPVLLDGRALVVEDSFPKADPPTYLLHYHQIGPIERIGDRYDATTRRLSAINRTMGWGQRPAGVVHAQEKRDLICPFLRRVVS